MIALRDKNLVAQSEIPISVTLRDHTVDQISTDILVENNVIVGLEATSGLSQEHQAQGINDLKATGIKVGLLINFGRPKIEIKRLRK